MIMQCLFKEVQQCYISSKKSPNQNTVVFKYYRTIEFVYISCQHKFSENWNLFAFTCNAKSLALAIFFFLLLIAVFERTGISFLPIKFLLHIARVTRIRLTYMTCHVLSYRAILGINCKPFNH